MSVPRSSFPTEIANVVVGADFECELDLLRIAVDMDIGEVDYDADNFPGVIVRLTEPSATVLVFRSGKVVCTGAETVENAREAIRVVADHLLDLGAEVADEPSTHVENIVMNGDLGTSLNLAAIAIGLGLESVEYEPEQFPGLVYRPEELDVVLILFSTGKTIITGLTRPGGAKEVLAYVADRLDEIGLLS